MSTFSGAVLLPTLANEKDLERCISSILLDRDAEKLRIYLVQNGATQISAQVLKLLRSSDVVLTSSHPNSISSALNLGAKAVEEELIFRMDDDDLWLSGRFREQYSAFERGADLVLGKSNFRTTRNCKIPQGRITNLEVFSPSLLHLGNFIVHPSVAIKRDLMQSIEYRDTASEDYDLWLRIFQNKLCWEISSPVISYTSRRNSTSNQLVGSERYTLVHDAFTQFSTLAGLPKISLPSFMVLTGQGGQSILVPLDDRLTSELIEYILRASELVAFSEHTNRTILFDHVFSIMIRNPKYFTPLIKQLGWHSAYISGLLRRGYRELLK